MFIAPLLILTFLTRERNKVYRTAITLYEDMVAKSPRKVRPHNRLSRAYLEAGRVREKIDQDLIILQLCDDPKTPQVQGLDRVNVCAQTMVNLAGVYIDLGNLGQAETYLNVVLQKYPDYRGVYHNLSTLELRRGNFQGAINWINKEGLTGDEEQDLGVQYNWGEALNAMHRCTEAETHYKVFRKWYPDFKIKPCS